MSKLRNNINKMMITCVTKERQSIDLHSMDSFLAADIISFNTSRD